MPATYRGRSGEQARPWSVKEARRSSASACRRHKGPGDFGEEAPDRMGAWALATYRHLRTKPLTGCGWDLSGLGTRLADAFHRLVRWNRTPTASWKASTADRDTPFAPGEPESQKSASTKLQVAKNDTAGQYIHRSPHRGVIAPCSG